MKSYYPILLDIEKKTVVVIGGGRVALRKVQDLLEADATVRLVSPDICKEITDLQDIYSKIEISQREYRAEDIKDAFLVFAATDDTTINSRVRDDSRNAGIPVNVADDLRGSSFTVPSFARKGDLVIALSTGGKSPAYAAKLRREIEDIIPGDIDQILDVLYEVRNLLINDSGFSFKSDERGRILKALVTDEEALAGLTASYKTPDFKKNLKNFCLTIIPSV